MRRSNLFGYFFKVAFLRFDGVTDRDRFREEDPRQDEGMQKKWYRKKRGKGGTYSGMSLVGR